MSKNIEVRLERIKIMRAAFFYDMVKSPEEESWKKTEVRAKKKGILLL